MEEDLVNLEDSSKVYGGAPFGKAQVDSTERLRSNSVEERSDCRSNILPKVDESVNYEKINNLIRKNFNDREALKKDLNNLKQRKPEKEPTLLGEGEQLRLELIHKLDYAIKECKNKDGDIVMSEDLFLGKQALQFLKA